MTENLSTHPSTSLAATAHWTAAVRAAENARPDALFHDPWAAALAGEAGQAWLAQRAPERVAPIALRTRYFDEVLPRALEDGTLRQVVLLAAGLDTRAYRLDWPAGTRLFELDQAGVLAHKETVLAAAGAAPRCARVAIAADLSQPWQVALLGAGFDPAQPAAWLLEGFLFYLPVEAITRILDDVSALAAPGSWLGFDIVNSITLTHPATRAWIEMQAASGAPWCGSLDDPEAFLAARGWQASLTQAGQPEIHHGRWALPVLPVKMPGVPHNWLVTARKIS
jgi:methyltransferase (TIGR00027 family)